jgi:hypothetical protein
VGQLYIQEGGQREMGKKRSGPKRDHFKEGPENVNYQHYAFLIEHFSGPLLFFPTAFELFFHVQIASIDFSFKYRQ